ncbi:MAG: hypothetical protein HY075_03215 [Deltaproteobacteria bacterium]|nr:hypothetical protein [Deltaproteobacteria bacterium]
MKRGLLIFVCGVAVGYLLHWQDTVAERQSALKSEAPRTAAPVAPARMLVTAERPRELSRPAPAERQRDSDRDREARATAEPARETTAALDFDEGTVQEMERAKDVLRELVYTENTAEGWRVHVLREDNLLTRSGLRDGDLITFDSVNSQLASPERGKLASRVVDLLNYIER